MSPTPTIRDAAPHVLWIGDHRREPLAACAALVTTLMSTRPRESWSSVFDIFAATVGAMNPGRIATRNFIFSVRAATAVAAAIALIATLWRIVRRRP